MAPSLCGVFTLQLLGSSLPLIKTNGNQRVSVLNCASRLSNFDATFLNIEQKPRVRTMNAKFRSGLRIYLVCAVHAAKRILLLNAFVEKHSIGL